MGVILSNIPPLEIKNGEHTIEEYINEKAKFSDYIVIASGYASSKSILELDKIIRDHGNTKITLILGMYFIEGFPEGIYKTAIQVNNVWARDGIGEIRVIKSMKYHGKVYGFYQKGRLCSASVGSHNLGSIVSDANNLRQYELSVFTEQYDECKIIADHLKSLIKTSSNIANIRDIRIVHEENAKLLGVEGVTKVSQADVEAYKATKTDVAFEIPLKVPGMPGERDDFMKSNVNKCYAKGRLNTRTNVVTERGWWETEVIVGTSITNSPTYPEKDVPFYVITDDGWKFKAHVSGDHKKNFESDGDLKILGYWLKGRLVAAGIVEPVDSPSADLINKDVNIEDPYRKCKGVITYQKLLEYGRTTLKLIKTLNTFVDEDGTESDVWILSFLPDSVY